MTFFKKVIIKQACLRILFSPLIFRYVFNIHEYNKNNTKICQQAKIFIKDHLWAPRTRKLVNITGVWGSFRKKKRLVGLNCICLFAWGQISRVHHMPFTMSCLLNIVSVVKHTEKWSCSVVRGVFWSVTYLEFQLQYALLLAVSESVPLTFYVKVTTEILIDWSTNNKCCRD